MLKFSDVNNNFNTPIYNFEDGLHFENLILNQDPDFFSPYDNNMIIGVNSSAINQGSHVFSKLVPYDILNTDRMSNPDLGAYQHSIQND